VTATPYDGPDAAPRIDAHHHVWSLGRRPQPWTDDLPVLQRSFEFAELDPQLRQARIGATVVVHTVASAEETRELLALAADEPRIAGVVGWLDLASPALDDELDAIRELPDGSALVGVRHQLQAEPDKEWLDRPAVRRGLASLARHGLVYDLVVSPEQLSAVTRTVAELPEASFVLDHAGKPPIASGDLRRWSADVAALSRHANVAVKISGLATEADWRAWQPADLRPVVSTLLEHYGADRLMFGSDWPVCLLAGADYELVAATAEDLIADLGATERDRIWGGTAREVYGLDLA
jgi:L-fuconolactonase